MTVSKNILLTLLTLLVGFSVFSSSILYAAQEDEERLTTEERTEQHRKRKPEIAKRKAIRAALKALRKNGALERASRRRSSSQAVQRDNRAAARAVTTQTTDPEMEDVVAIKHVLTCVTEANCLAAAEWANNNNFNATGALTSEGHGGEVMYHLFLRQEITPDEDTITSESSRVHTAIKTLDGIRYATWMVDLDPTGQQDGRGNQ